MKCTERNRESRSARARSGRGRVGVRGDIERGDLAGERGCGDGDGAGARGWWGEGWEEVLEAVTCAIDVIHNTIVSERSVKFVGGVKLASVAIDHVALVLTNRRFLRRRCRRLVRAYTQKLER